MDASAIVELFTGRTPDLDLRRRALTEQGAAPELLDIDAAHTLRALVLRGDLTEQDGPAKLRQVQQSPIARVSHRQLLDRVWALRHSLTAYDAAYVALAEQLGVPLLTCDRRLARAHGHSAQVEHYPTS